MTDEQRKERWKSDTDELYRSIGEFVVKFQLACDTIQTCILFMLERAGLRDQKVAQILLSGMTAEPLRTLYESLAAQTSMLNDRESQVLKNALNRFQRLTEARNDIVHATWFIGYGNESTTDFSEAAGVKYHKNKSGAAAKSLRRKAEDFRKLSREAECLTHIFARLDACFHLGRSVEKNFVVDSCGRVCVAPKITK